VPNQIHTFTVTATNSEGYTSTSYSTFITIAPPPVLANQSVTVQSGTLATVPFNYSGTYPANHATETIVTPPSYGTVAIQSNGSINYQNDNSANAGDSFQFSVIDTAGNPSNVETVILNIQDQVDPALQITTPPTDNSGSYAYGQVVDGSYTCTDNVQIASCTASQLVDGVPTSVANGSPIDTTSLIIGDTHSLTFTAVDWAGNTTTHTVTYKVNTPAPIANDDSATTINPNFVLIPVLSNDTHHFPFDPSTVTVLSSPTSGSTFVEPSGAIKYTPTSASDTSVTNDSFTYTVADTDSQVSNIATVDVTIYPVPQVTSISPTAGPLPAGTPVVITGTGFVTTSNVMFGSVPALNYSIDDNTHITAVAPAAPGNAPATRDITVTTSGGTTATSTADTYTWDPVPTVTSITPPGNNPVGGGTITVNGTGFTQGRAGLTHLSFGGTPATNVVVSSDTQLTATIPAGTLGNNSSEMVDVTTTTPGGTSATSSADRFTYFYTPPTVTSVSPSAGPFGGGTSVSITGRAFTGATAVKFGSTPATSFTVNSDSSITAISPPGTSGSRVDIKVTNPGGTSAVVSADQFTYGPQVTGVSPSTGATVGGTSVTISGYGFTGASVVSFGSTPITTFTINGDGSITVSSPPESIGVVDVTVTTPQGTSPTSAADHFSYFAPVPGVSGVSPSSGSVGGGQTVTIAGNNLSGATAVMFGTTAAAIVSTSNTSVTVTTPAESAGTVNVTVTTPGGTSAVTSGDRYTFGPAVTGVSPASGSTSGGTSVMITGTDLTGASAVLFGTTPAASFAPISSTQVSAVAPAGTGTVFITVTATDGTSPQVAAGAFAYHAPVPVVTSISPSNGSAAGATSVTVTGVNFTGVTGVSFGGVAATSFSVNGAGTSITATSPAGTAGTTIDVTVTGPGGTSGVVTADKFTYGAVVSGISPSSGNALGGSTVIITGTGFTSATGVAFGTTPAASYTVNSATSITAVSPAHAAGVVDVTVKYGLSFSTPTVSADQFTFLNIRPVVSSISQKVGTPAGGTTVTITGSGFTGATSVSFGTNPAASMTVNSNTSITAVSPAGAATSTVDITVTAPGGTSAATTADQFTYGPVVTSLSPNAGTHLGGTTVTITGAGYGGATSVKFGSVSVTTGITISTDGTQITVKAPPGAAGTVDVTVTAGGFTSKTNASDKFTYV
jgi:hypothetical protein